MEVPRQNEQRGRGSVQCACRWPPVRACNGNALVHPMVRLYALDVQVSINLKQVPIAQAIAIGTLLSPAGWVPENRLLAHFFEPPLKLCFDALWAAFC